MARTGTPFLNNREEVTEARSILFISRHTHQNMIVLFIVDTLEDFHGRNNNLPLSRLLVRSIISESK